MFLLQSINFAGELCKEYIMVTLFLNDTLLCANYPCEDMFPCLINKELFGGVSEVAAKHNKIDAAHFISICCAPLACD